MRHVGTWSAVVLALSTFGVAGCGGSGHGFSIGTDPIVITTNQLPPTLSGEIVNYPIPFTGGGGGPYLLELSSGTLPLGISFDNQTVALVGRALEDGVFHFVLRLTDTGTTPFSMTLMAFDWTIGIGALVFATDTVLPSYVYNRFDSIVLQVAGGTPPYAAQVVDVATDPLDEPLPSGLAIPNNSTTIVGAPTGVKPGTPPFTYLVSIEAHDHADIPGYPNPLRVVKRFQITVLVPEVVITTLSVKNGTCGQGYSDKIEIVDGIPPFTHHIVTALNSTTMLVGEPGTPSGAAKGSGPTAYPLNTVAGPYTAKFPEGIYLLDASGDIVGIPHRSGTFNTWTYHVQSNVLPALASQNKWKTFSFSMLDSAPPAVVLDPSVLVSGTFALTGLGTIPSLEVGVAYRSGNGLTFLCTGGVSYDGRFDGVHGSQAISNAAEVVGNYDFSATTFGPPGIPAGMTFSAAGKFSGTPLASARGGYRTISLSAADQQLPLPSPATHRATGLCRYDVGPDSTIITESTQSSTATQIDDSTDYNVQTVEVLETFSGTPVVRAVAAADLAATHTNPTGGTLAATLTGIDFLRASVNPTWWAYDTYNINARSARAMQHADRERRFSNTSFGGDTTYPNSYSGYNTGYEHTSNAAIEVPTTKPVAPITVTHNPAAGVYTDGGLLYCFDSPSANEFGFFMVRRDGKLYVPACLSKSATTFGGPFAGLGDGWLASSTSKTAQFRMPQIAVSPDGRFAAAKLKLSVDNFAETAGLEKLLLFSLTGEKMFGGSTFAVIGIGGAGNTTDGQYFYGQTITLTNFSAYFLRGNNIGSTSANRVIYGDHWIYRATIFSPSTGAYLAPASAALLSPLFGGLGGWTNNTSNALSAWNSRWCSPGSTGAVNQNTPWYAADVLGSQSNIGTSMTSVSPNFFAYNWANFWETSMAPMPFRVSANGHACAMVAGANQPTANPSAAFMRYSVYVDYDNVFREAAGAVRRYRPPTRIGGMHPGEEYSYLYGWFDGPGTQFEISDAGANIACVYNTSTTAWYSDSSAYYNNHGNGDPANRDEIVVLNGTGASTDPWSTKSESPVTINIFAGGNQWRFGSLAFSRDNKALVFWGGYSMSGPQSFYYYYSEYTNLCGSLYSYTLGASNSVQGILPSSSGGHTDVTGTVVNYSSGSPLSSSASTFSGDQGSIAPNGSFFSNDGNFYWMEAFGGLTANSSTPSRLIAVNMKDNTTTINGRAPQRAFAPNWVPYYGFENWGYYYGGLRWYGAGNTNGHVGKHISVGSSNGLVYYAAVMQYYDGSGYATTFDYPGNFRYLYNTGPAHPTAWYDYGIMQGEVFGIDTSVGGSPFKLSNFANAAPLSASAARVITYIQPNQAGTKISITSTNTPGFSMPILQNQEQLRVISNIAVTASGALSGTPSIIVVEGTGGRSGPSVAFDFTDTRMFYGFTTGGNDNGMALKEVTFNSSGTAVASSRSFAGTTGTTARFAVLWSGR